MEKRMKTWRLAAVAVLGALLVVIILIFQRVWSIRLPLSEYLG
jgi:hypothetical protein